MKFVQDELVVEINKWSHILKITDFKVGNGRVLYHKQHDSTENCERICNHILEGLRTKKCYWDDELKRLVWKSSLHVKIGG